MVEPRDDGTFVLELSGELDAVTAPDAHAMGMQALQLSWLSHLVIDMGAVTFIGSAGLGVLVSLGQAAQSAGIGLSLDRVSAKIYRVFQISGLAGSFEINREDA